MSGALAVMLGAVGAHGLRKHVSSEKLLKTWETAAHYHLIHSVGTRISLFVASIPDRDYL